MTMDQTEIDQTTVEEFQETVVTEAAAALSAACCYLGDMLGLYEAMADAGPLTSAELAARTDTNERYVREWLANQGAGGYVTHHADDGTFELPAEHAAVLADHGGPADAAGLFSVIAAVWASADRIADAFRSGTGLGWHEHDRRLFRGLERLNAPIYRHELVQDFIPALDGVHERLSVGARVADVGCGHGASTIAMAQAYPASRFTGFDSHPESIAVASKAAAEAGVGDRVAFETAPADGFGGDGYDLVCFFDCLHDMGDPVRAAAHAREVLADDGALLLVEPMAEDELADNLHPLGRLFYAGSVFLCVPSSLAQDGAAGLGGQAGEARLREVLAEAGWSHARRAMATPFNLVIEARP
jgi:SAM-dependent methyltransferase